MNKLFRLFMLFACLLCSMISIAGQPFGVNLIPNSSFEKHSGGVPDGWEKLGEDQDKGLSLIEGDAYSGKSAIAIDASKTEASFKDGSGTFWRSVPVPCEPGSVYQAMGFIKPNQEAKFFMNPLQLVFIDKQGKRIDPFAIQLHNKEIQRSFYIRNEQWNLIMTRPMAAPRNAAMVAIEFRGMHRYHFPHHQAGVYYYYNQNRLLLDNVALWKTASQKPAYHVNSDGKPGRLVNMAGNFDHYLDIVLQEGCPPALEPGGIRQNSTFVSVVDDSPGRIVFGNRNKVDFNARIYNLLSVDRELNFHYRIIDWLGIEISKGTLPSIRLSPYAIKNSRIELRIPERFGAFTVVYTLTEGKLNVGNGHFSFGVIAKPNPLDSKEIFSDKYPFMIFSTLASWMEPKTVNAKIELLKYAGVPFRLTYEHISWFDPKMTPEQMDAQLEQRYAEKIKFDRKLIDQGLRLFFSASILPGHMDGAVLEKYSLFWSKLVAKIDYIHSWFYGGETIGGTQIDPDRIYREKGMWKFEGTVRDFFNGYRAAWSGAKKIDPASRFIMMFHNDDKAVAIRHAYSVGKITNNMFDGLAINCYGTLLHAWEQNIAVLKQHGAGDKPLYVPEVGDRVQYSDNIVDRKKSELSQAVNIIKYYILALNRYPTIAQISYFSLVGSPGAHGICDGLDKASPFSGYVAFHTMSSILGAKHSLRLDKVDFNEVAIWTRERDKRDVLVAWGPGRIKVKADGIITVTDLMGNQSQIGGGGSRSIQLSERPVFIEGDNVALHYDNTMTIAAKVSPTQNPGSIKTDISLGNSGNESITGTLAMESRSPAIAPMVIENIVIPPKQTLSGFSVSLPPDASGFRAIFKSDAGQMFDRDITFSQILAPRTDGVPRIDGSWEGWNRGNPIVMGEKQLRPSPVRWKGEADLSAVVWFNWNDEYLFFGAEVRDDHFIPVKDLYKGNMALFRNDSIELGINSGRKHIEFDIGLFNGKSVAEQTIPVFRKLNQVKVCCHYQVDKGLISYQTAIPWKTLNIRKVSAGNNFRMAIAIPDKDYDHDGNPEKGIRFNDGIWGAKDPGMYGAVTLVDMLDVPVAAPVPGLSAKGFRLKSENQHLILRPESDTSPSDIELNTFRRSSDSFDVELASVGISGNTSVSLNATLAAEPPQGLKLVVKWFDTEGADLGAKAALFGFEDHTIIQPLDSSKISVRGRSQAQSSRASICLRVEKDDFPSLVKLSIGNLRLVPDKQ
ncbi:MAG: hypothetical protein JXR78_19445 [Victivallales bacterium]|nr:hypothetical protein [Victivallales bacterium]